MAQEYNPADFDLDQQTYLDDERIHHRIANRIDRLKERGEANASTEDPLLREGETELQ
ncbi:hypothetical protein [Rufibacter sp. XAAS-G3-1]|uniref:hypothetical protein n=1 Tax=Rufibacter sp. XAAS-G3-1 TaxID=2729134 RepID=UPI0015E6D76A|nr:hypothetical protein [Rufibacter sp. XAAS-G3-1]